MRKLVLLLVALAAMLCSYVPPAAADGPVVGLLYSRPQYARLKSGDDPLKSYREAVTCGGGSVIALAPLYNSRFLSEMEGIMQGLLVPGGDDVDPKYYGEQNRPELEEYDTAFDEFEMAIVRRAAARRVPILGICRGMQLVNVCFGGSLYQDLPTQLRAKESVTHRVRVEGKTVAAKHLVAVESGTVLYGLVSARSVEVNTYHHQAVKALAPGFRISASSADGVAEAMESVSGLTVCVQFHPERLRTHDSRFDGLFTWLVQKASEVKPVLPVKPQ